MEKLKDILGKVVSWVDTKGFSALASVGIGVGLWIFGYKIYAGIRQISADFSIFYADCCKIMQLCGTFLQDFCISLQDFCKLSPELFNFLHIYAHFCIICGYFCTSLRHVCKFVNQLFIFSAGFMHNSATFCKV